MKRYLVSLIVFFLFLAEAHSAKKIVVGVSEFKNLTGDEYYDRFCTGIGESITGDLANIRSIEVVERVQMINIIKKIPKFIDNLDNEETAVELGKMINANLMVIGSIQATEKEMLITARFVNVETGAVIGGEKVRGKKEEIFDLYNQIIFKLTGSLGIEVTPSEKKKIEKPETPKFNAYENLALAKRVNYYERDRKKALEKAKELAEKAIEIDPKYREAKKLREELIAELFWIKDKETWNPLPYLTFDFFPLVPGQVNAQYEINSKKKPQTNLSLLPVWKLKYREFIAPAFSFGGGVSFGNVGTFGFGLDIDLLYWLVNTRRTVFYSGLGFGFGTLSIEQNYASPNNQESGKATYNKAPVFTKIFTCFTWSLIPRKLFLNFELGYTPEQILQGDWIVKKKVKEDGEEKEKEQIIPKEWLEYEYMKLGGPYFGIAIGFRM